MRRRELLKTLLAAPVLMAVPLPAIVEALEQKPKLQKVTESFNHFERVRGPSAWCRVVHANGDMIVVDDGEAFPEGTIGLVPRTMERFIVRVRTGDALFVVRGAVGSHQGQIHAGEWVKAMARIPERPVAQ